MMRVQVAQFLDHIAGERGLSANTCAAYRVDLEAFLAFLKRDPSVSTFSAVTRRHIAAFLEEQRGQGLRAATRARRLAAVKVFFAFLAAEDLVPCDVAAVMDSPAKGRVLPRTLSEAETARWIVSAGEGGTCSVRDRSMLELLYACGLRVSELIALRVGDFRREEGLVTCTGKGDKQRRIPLGAAARAWLDRYLAEVRPRFAKGNPAEPRLYLTRRGEGFTRQGVSVMVKKRAREAGVIDPVSPHVLRHCFASHLLARGAQIRVIQELLGHADIATTQIYTHVNEGQVLRTHARFHPRH